MKTCSKCKEARPLAGFAKNKAKKDGLQNQCRACKAATQRNWYERNKERHKKNCGKIRDQRRIVYSQFVWDYLLEHPCVDCGEADPVVLDFDHVRGTKTLNISAMGGYSLTKVKEEIDKCEVRCRNCHQRKTARDFNFYKNINTGR